MSVIYVSTQNSYNQYNNGHTTINLDIQLNLGKILEDLVMEAKINNVVITENFIKEFIYSFSYNMNYSSFGSLFSSFCANYNNKFHNKVLDVINSP